MTSVLILEINDLMESGKSRSMNYFLAAMEFHFRKLRMQVENVMSYVLYLFKFSYLLYSKQIYSLMQFYTYC